MAAAAAFFLLQSRIKIQYLKTAITSLFFRIQKILCMKIILQTTTFPNVYFMEWYFVIWHLYFQVKCVKCNILFYNCLNTEICWYMYMLFFSSPFNEWMLVNQYISLMSQTHNNYKWKEHLHFIDNDWSPFLQSRFVLQVSIFNAFLHI